jgi:hypothetical protein
MPNWFADHALSIGRTPLVRLNRITRRAPATLLAKIEGRSPAYSVKCRLGAALIWDLEKRGLLGPGKEIVEPTRSSHRLGHPRSPRFALRRTRLAGSTTATYVPRRSRLRPPFRP